jgi:Polyketide cyclase / dehydrase and lipid transport
MYDYLSSNCAYESADWWQWGVKSNIWHTLRVGQIKISQKVNAPSEVLWTKLSDLASHPTWMKDAESLEFLTNQESGVGAKMRVPTRVGPFRTTDILEITGWVEDESITVRHEGLVKGEGKFTISGDDQASLIKWEEALTFPWWMGGPIGEWFAHPILRLIWVGNLKRFANQISGESRV